MKLTIQSGGTNEAPSLHFWQVESNQHLEKIQQLTKQHLQHNSLRIENYPIKINNKSAMHRKVEIYLPSADGGIFFAGVHNIDNLFSQDSYIAWKAAIIKEFPDCGQQFASMEKKVLQTKAFSEKEAELLKDISECKRELKIYSKQSNSFFSEGNDNQTNQVIYLKSKISELNNQLRELCNAQYNEPTNGPTL